MGSSVCIYIGTMSSILQLTLDVPGPAHALGVRQALRQRGVRVAGSPAGGTQVPAEEPALLAPAAGPALVRALPPRACSRASVSELY